jgi:ribonuclease P protein component
VHEKGRRVSSPWFTLLGLPSPSGSPRIGITVSRKVGGAVARNRIKRIFREIFRYNRPALEPPLDLVVVARPGAADRTMRELEREFLKRFAELARRFEKR